MAMYVGPIILLALIWYLNLVEQKKEQPNEKHIAFFRVIAGMFAVMQLFALFLANGSAISMLGLLVLTVISLMLTATIVVPINSMPTAYQAFIQKMMKKK